MRGLAGTLRPAAMLLLLCAVAGCHESSTGKTLPVLPPGTVNTQLPDNRLFLLGESDGELRTLDGNEPRSEASEPIPLLAAPVGGIALDPQGNRLWVSHRNQGVVVYDASDLELIAALPAGIRPGAIAIDGRRGLVFVTNEDSDTVTVICADPPFEEHADSPIAVGTQPVAIEIVADQVVVANQGSDTISVFAATEPFAALGGSPFAVGSGPADLEVDGGDELVFVANRGAGSISVFEVATSLVTTPITGLDAVVQLGRHGRQDLLFAATDTGLVHVLTSTLAPVEDADSPLDFAAPLGGLAVNTFLDQVTVTLPGSDAVRVFSAEAPFALLDGGEARAGGPSPGRCFGLEPVAVQTLLSPSGGSVLSSLPQGDLLFVAHGTSGLVVLRDGDFREAFADRLISTVAMPGETRYLLLRDQWAFISNGGNGLQIADLSSIQNPVIERTLGGIGDADELYFYGGNLVVDANGAGVRVIDVRNPVDPIVIGAFNPGGGATGFDFHLESRLAYSASGGATLFVMDLFLPDLPVLQEIVDVPVDCDDVAVIEGHEALLATGVGGVRGIEIRPPAVGSQILGQIDIGAAAGKVQMLGGLGFTTAADGNVSVLRTDSVAILTRLGVLDGVGAPVDFQRQGSYLYVAEGSTGLTIYRFYP